MSMSPNPVKLLMPSLRKNKANSLKNRPVLKEYLTVKFSTLETKRYQISQFQKIRDFRSHTSKEKKIGRLDSKM